jgi:hypothetical protein
MGYWRTRRLKQKPKSGVIFTMMGVGFDSGFKQAEL